MSTSQGTTPLKKFVIGEFPEVIENEIDGEPIAAAVSLPVTINGRIFHGRMSIYGRSPPQPVTW